MTYNPRFTNIVSLLSKSIEHFPSRPVFGTRKNHGWHFITYTEFGALVSAMRGGLAKLGIGRGERVAVISDNRVEWAVGSFGTLSSGAVYVPMYQAQKDSDFRYILRDSGATLVLCANREIAARIESVITSP